MISLVLVCIVRKIIREWLEWILYKDCDYESYRLYQEKIMKMKRYRNNVGVHLASFNTYLVLGCYDECPKEIDELDRLSSRMSGKQAVTYGLLKVDYLLETSNSYSDLAKEIDQIDEAFHKLKKISKNEKVTIQKGIMTRTYLADVICCEL